MGIKNKVKRYYDRLYGKQEFKRQPLVMLWSRKRELEKIFKLIKKEYAILDIGCGEGEPSLFLASKAKEVVGFDISKEAIKSAKRKLNNGKIKNCSFSQGDIDNISYPENSFDFVLCLGIFEYFPSIEKPLKNIYNILKPGGILYFHVWNAEYILINFKRLFGPIDKDNSFERHFFTRSEVEKILTKNGFVLKNCYGQLIANIPFTVLRKLHISYKNKHVFNFIENLGKLKFIARFFGGNLAFISKKPETSRLL